MAAVQNSGLPPIPFEEIVLATLATFAAAEALKRGTAVSVSLDSASQRGTSE